MLTDTPPRQEGHQVAGVASRLTTLGSRRSARPSRGPHQQGQPLMPRGAAGNEGQQLHPHQGGRDHRPDQRDDAWRSMRARAKYALQAASHPAADAIDPTSVMGIKMALPKKTISAVIRPMPSTAAVGYEIARGPNPVVRAPGYAAFTVAVRRHAVTSLMTFSYSAVMARST